MSNFAVKNKIAPRTFRNDEIINLRNESIVFGQSGLDSWGAQNLRVCIFEIIKATELYFTFLETSNLYLFRGQAPKDMEAL